MLQRCRWKSEKNMSQHCLWPLKLGVQYPIGLFFCIKMAFFDVSAHTLHSLGQVTVTVSLGLTV